MAYQNSRITKIVQVRTGLYHIYTTGGIYWAGVKVVAGILGRTIAETRKLQVKIIG